MWACLPLLGLVQPPLAHRRVDPVILAVRRRLVGSRLGLGALRRLLGDGECGARAGRGRGLLLAVLAAPRPAARLLLRRRRLVAVFGAELAAGQVDDGTCRRLGRIRLARRNRLLGRGRFLDRLRLGAVRLDRNGGRRLLLAVAAAPRAAACLLLRGRRLAVLRLGDRVGLLLRHFLVRYRLIRNSLVRCHIVVRLS